MQMPKSTNESDAEKNDNAPNFISDHAESQSGSTQTTINKQMNRNEERERFCTLSIIAVTSLLTGIDYAIILPTAWGYINTFMQEHFGGFVMGVLLSVFALSGAISGIILGYLNDIGVSLKRLVLVGIAFLILGNILYFIGINIYVLVFSRFIAGIGMGLVPPLLAEITRLSTPRTRTQLLAKILGCRQIGLFLGPCLTILFRETQFDLFGLLVTKNNAPGLFMAVLWSVVELLAFFFFYDSPTSTNEPRTWSNSLIHYSCRSACVHIGKMCRRPVILVLLITSFIAYFNQTTLETTLTPFTNVQFNWQALQVSFLFAFAGVEITLVYLTLHILAKKFSDRSILLAGYLLLTVACLIAVIVLPLSTVGSTKYLPVFLLFVALDVLALPLIVVPTTSLFTQHTDADQQGIGQGIQRSVINIATVVGPLYAGGLLSSTWLMMIIMFIIVLIATLILLLVYRRFQSRTIDESSSLISSEEH